MYTLQFENGLMISALSILGKRQQQQDYYASMQMSDRTIAIVCDGMGGLDGGELASKTAADLLMQDLIEVDENEDMHLFFQKELEKLDDIIFGLRREDGTRIGAGTTLVSVLILKNNLYWFSVGDSKLYYKRGNEFFCVTREHNLAMRLKELRDNRQIDEAQYEASMGRGDELISYLGLGMAEIFDSNYSPVEMQLGDKILLCTDGLYRAMEDSRIEQILSSCGTSERICQMFENEIVTRNKQNQDNATWIVLQKLGGRYGK